MSDYTLASMSEQVLRLERELKNEQEKLTAYERTNNLAILQEEGNVRELTWPSWRRSYPTRSSNSSCSRRTRLRQPGDGTGGPAQGR